MKRRTFLQLFGLSAISTRAIAKIEEDDKGGLVIAPTEQQNTYAVKYYTRNNGEWEEVSFP